MTNQMITALVIDAFGRPAMARLIDGRPALSLPSREQGVSHPHTACNHTERCDRSRASKPWWRECRVIKAMFSVREGPIISPKFGPSEEGV